MGDRKRRLWSDDEKRTICLQASVPGVSVAQVARRYSMNANLIFKWLREERFASAVEDETGSSFLPVEVCRDLGVDLPSLSNAPPVSGGRLQIELSGGHRIMCPSGKPALSSAR